MNLDASSVVNSRVFNFSAGPAVLPLSVLQRAQEELLCLPGAGASILEISHRSSQFSAILEQAVQNLTQLLNIPSNYRVLLMQGGSTLQFSMVPMNLMKGTGQTADYILTGAWGKKAFAEAKKQGPTKAVWDGSADGYRATPHSDDLNFSDNSAYVYYTSNETIEGVQFAAEPEVGSIPLVCDASSDFLHRPLPVEKYGLIYACAQKNAGPSGVTVVIIRDDLLERAEDSLPGYCNYRSHADNGSMFNTPPTFAIYLLNLVAEWLLNEAGGLAAMHEKNQQKAKMLYDVIDSSVGFYQGHAEENCRSLMNVTFRLPDDARQAKFVDEAAKRDLCNLKGHRSVGGIRASIYNAMPTEGVESLRDFMVEFQANNA